MSKHTPTPWVAAVEISDGGGWRSPEQLVTISSGETVVAYYATSYCDFPSDEENAANAAYIVRAVNAHEGLVDALNSIGEYLAESFISVPDEVVSKVLSALSAAKE